MVIDCNNPESILAVFNNEQYPSFPRGSGVYNTMDVNSDLDWGIIVPDDTEFIDIEGAFDNVKSDSRLHPSVLVEIDDFENDIQFVCVSDFIDMIHEHSPFAIEAIFIADPRLVRFKDEFILDKWMLRKSFDKISNNSWSKAHKKMTVDKDLDMKCGVKSLYHSIRLYNFACQIAEYGQIVSFTQTQGLWKEIKSDWESGFTWEDFKAKYKPVYNEWHSKLVALCPKPEEEYKNKRSAR